MTVDARRFDGTLGSAKAVAEWCGLDKACFGATYGNRDEQDGGLNLVTTQSDGSLFYTDVPKGHWVVVSDGALAVFDEAQFAIAFPALVG